MRRRRRYYEPEDLGHEQDLRDAADPNRRFFVYVLDTDYGHYVGHTAHVGSRLREHQDGEVPSTAGGHPTLVWKSGPRATRKDAAGFEAAMESLRDQRAVRFKEITALNPIPFANPSMSGPGPSRRGSSHGRRGYGRPHDDWLARFLRREIRGLFRSRRKRRMWGAIAVGIVLLVVYASNGGF
ncbi:MAG: hypothetical protein OXI51_09125 [Chloroflexota bacterium]|nr:hypothetical protein [Chloroflexota bacterium]